MTEPRRFRKGTSDPRGLTLQELNVFIAQAMVQGASPDDRLLVNGKTVSVASVEWQGPSPDESLAEAKRKLRAAGFSWKQPQESTDGLALDMLQQSWDNSSS
jgi:hypothetical protein